jgi:hypothetical protein
MKYCSNIYSFIITYLDDILIFLKEKEEYI